LDDVRVSSSYMFLRRTWSRGLPSEGTNYFHFVP
jgi:hypothetical protein